MDREIADSTIMHRRPDLAGTLSFTHFVDDGIKKKVSIRGDELEGFLGKALPTEKEKAGMMRGASDR